MRKIKLFAFSSRMARNLTFSTLACRRNSISVTRKRRERRLKVYGNVRSLFARQRPTSPTGAEPGPLRYWQLEARHSADFRALGFNRRSPFFPHELYFIPKAGPDGLLLATQMADIRHPDMLWQISLHAAPSAREEFPAELFFDENLVWHRQHLDRPGHIAFANLALCGRELFGLGYVSDTVQRISRRRRYKGRIEKRFRGWDRLILNAVFHFALEHDVTKIYSPTSQWMLAHTDPARDVDGALFERVYDRAVTRSFDAQRTERWWVIDVRANRDRAVRPQPREEALAGEKTICICHDIEGGHGHVGVDPEFARAAEKRAPKALADMLLIEREMGVRATYNVLGRLLADVRGRIESDGHCIAFHSYDHRLRSRQLRRCRQVDYRIKGYRPPQSKMTRELRPRKLCLHNFEWLAAGRKAVGTVRPTLQRRVVKIPIAFDDYDLHTGRTTFEEWERRALETIKENPFVAFGLHDCYGEHWLPGYRRFLRQVRSLGRLRTLDEVAHRTFLSASR